MFEQLKGIKKEREDSKREENIVDLLIGFGQGVAENHHHEINKNTRQTLITYHVVAKEVYDLVFASAKEELPDFTEQDLAGFVMKAEQYFFDNLKRKKVFGIYTGCLLDILTARNKEKGKRTRVHINGQGKRFPYLFHFARNFDELILEDFKGKAICSYACAFEGNANLLYLDNIEGDDVIYRPGFQGGTIDMILAKNIKGNHALYEAKIAGKINLIFATGINSAHACGEYFRDNQKSNIGLMIAKEITPGKKAFPLNDQPSAGLFIKQNKRAKLGYEYQTKEMADFLRNSYPGARNETAEIERYRQRLAKEYNLMFENILIKLIDEKQPETINETIEFAKEIYETYLEIKKKLRIEHV